MKFCIVLPTIRQSIPGFDESIASISASFTHPTELHILDGQGGKCTALNQAYDSLLVGGDFDIYVTIDDDIIPPVGWQDEVCKAFIAEPKLGAVGLWLGDDPESLTYVGSEHCEAPITVGGATIRKLKGLHHIVGCLIAFRRQVAIDVGKLPDSDLTYQVWEDAWRGRRVHALGWELAFVQVEPAPRMIVYPDSLEYMETKKSDLEKGSKIAFDVLQTSGAKDHWVLRLRRKIARWRHRI